MTPRKESAPVGLAVRGRRFWRATVDKFDLSPAELLVLQEVCRTLDDLDRLDAAVLKHGAMVLGSTGQTVVNPALTEARGQRAILHRLVAALKLPDDEGEVLPSARSIRASRAAEARWAGHKKGAG